MKALNAPLLSLLVLYYLTLLIPPGILASWHVVWHGHPLRVSHILPITFIGLAALSSIRQGIQIDIKKEWTLGLLVIVWLAACWHAVDRAFSIQSTISFLLKGPVVGWLVFKNVRRYSQVVWMWRCLIIGIAFTVCVGLAGFVLGSQNAFFAMAANGRLSGTIGHPLPLGSLLVFVLPFSLDSSLFPLRIRRFLVCVIVSGLLLTLSRSSWLAAAIVLGAAGAWMPEVRPLLQRTCLIILLLCGFFCLTLWISGSGFTALNSYRANARERLSLSGMMGDSSARRHRLLSYITTAKMWWDRPVLGSGLGTFPSLYLQYRPPGDVEVYPTPDNMFLRLLAETGTLGLLAWVLLFVSWVLASLDRMAGSSSDQKKTRQLLMIASFGLILNSLFFDSFYWNPVMLTLSIGMGLDRKSVV
jgi:O-antigen ligase